MNTSAGPCRLARDAVTGGGPEPESLVVAGMPHHDNERAARSSEPLDAHLDQPGADPLALVFRNDRHRPEAQLPSRRRPHRQDCTRMCPTTRPFTAATNDTNVPPLALSASTMRHSSSPPNARLCTSRIAASSPVCSSRISIKVPAPTTARDARLPEQLAVTRPDRRARAPTRCVHRILAGRFQRTGRPTRPGSRERPCSRRDRAANDARTWHQIGEAESVARNRFANSHGNLTSEHRSSKTESMKLAPLTAGVDRRRYIRQQLFIIHTVPRRSLGVARDRCMSAPRAGRGVNIVRARACVSAGEHHKGNIGSIPVPDNMRMRYSRTSSKNKSPKAMWVIPSSCARLIITRILS